MIIKLIIGVFYWIDNTQKKLSRRGAEGAERYVFLDTRRHFGKKLVKEC